MAKITILCWQEIPSVVEARGTDGTHKVELSRRFLELIDAVAMQRKLSGTDEYLMHWRKERRPDREGSAADVARAVAAELEARFEEIKAEALRRPPPA